MEVAFLAFLGRHPPALNSIVNTFRGFSCLKLRFAIWLFSNCSGELDEFWSKMESEQAMMQEFAAELETMSSNWQRMSDKERRLAFLRLCMKADASGVTPRPNETHIFDDICNCSLDDQVEYLRVLLEGAYEDIRKLRESSKKQAQKFEELEKTVERQGNLIDLLESRARSQGNSIDKLESRAQRDRSRALAGDLVFVVQDASNV